VAIKQAIEDHDATFLSNLPNKHAPRHKPATNIDTPNLLNELFLFLLLF
jgi:hypothetical protein